MGFGLEAYAERHPEKCETAVKGNRPGKESEPPKINVYRRQSQDVKASEYLQTEIPANLLDLADLAGISIEDLLEEPKEERPSPQEIEEAIKFYRNYKRNENNIRQLETTLVAGAREGEDPCRLLMQACKAISFFTGNDGNTVYEQVEAYIIAVWGEETLKPKPLTMDMETRKRRLARLEEKLWTTPTGSKKDALQEVISAHKGLIARMGLLNEGRKPDTKDTLHYSETSAS